MSYKLIERSNYSFNISTRCKFFDMGFNVPYAVNIDNRNGFFMVSLVEGVFKRRTTIEFLRFMKMTERDLIVFGENIRVDVR